MTKTEKKELAAIKAAISAHSNNVVRAYDPHRNDREWGEIRDQILSSLAASLPGYTISISSPNHLTGPADVISLDLRMNPGTRDGSSIMVYSVHLRSSRVARAEEEERRALGKRFNRVLGGGIA